MSPFDPQLIEYFWSLVNKSGPLPDPSTGIKSRCWLWTGSQAESGYGRFRYKRTRYTPTRFAWRLKTGSDPGPLTISVKCQNKTCVRHLFSRTRSDMVRAVVNHLEYPPNGKLNTKEVLEIRKLFATGKFLQQDLATRFQVSRPAVGKIVRGESWRDL
jgi:hypothetical protein